VPWQKEEDELALSAMETTASAWSNVSSGIPEEDELALSAMETQPRLGDKNLVVSWRKTNSR